MPNDPNSWFQSYGRQIRAHSVQYAAGDIQSTQKDPFPTPDYFGKPRLSASLKTTFNNGNVIDPVNYQARSTFQQLFAAQPDTARAMAGHVVLESPSGQQTKRDLGMPYQAHSVVDSFKAAFFTARHEFQNVFGKNVWDAAAGKAGSYVANHIHGKSGLQILNSVLGGISEETERSIRANPVTYKHASSFAATAHSMKDEDDLGKAWGDLHTTFSDILGFGKSDAAKGKVNFGYKKISQFALRNVVGPGMLVGLTFAPLALEVISHVRHSMHQRVARNMAEEHHNLETPTGRHLKDIMGLPYQSHSIVDTAKSALFFQHVSHAFESHFKKEVTGGLALTKLTRQLPSVPRESQYKLEPLTTITARDGHLSGGYARPRADTPEEDARAVGSYFKGQSALVQLGARKDYQDVHTGIANALGRDYINAYHGTPKYNLKSIDVHGLKALPPHIDPTVDYTMANATGKKTGAGWKGVYTTSGLDIAMGYAKGQTGAGRRLSPLEEQNNIPAILRIKAPVTSLIHSENYGRVVPLHGEMLKDVAERPAYTSNTALNLGGLGEFAILGDIPRSNITFPNAIQIAKDQKQVAIGYAGKEKESFQYAKELEKGGYFGYDSHLTGRTPSEEHYELRKMNLLNAQRFHRQMRNLQEQAAIPKDVTLETPSGQDMKQRMGLPYREHSTIDLNKVKEFFSKVYRAFKSGIAPVTGDSHEERTPEFPQVRALALALEEAYPHLIAKPRRILKAVYDLQTSAYAYFAKHQNIYFSTFARTMLMAEKVEHVWDYTYKFSPGRQAAKLFRAAVGAEKRNYEHLAMAGISRIENGVEMMTAHALERRIVRVGGVIIGLTETAFAYVHAYDKALKLWHTYIRPEKDPEQKRQDELERERRQGYRDAKRKGQKYDPTLPARQTHSGEQGPGLLHEILEQLNPYEAGKRFVTAMRDPKKHIQSVAMYGAFGVYLATIGIQTQKHLAHELAHGAEKSLANTSYTFAKEFFHGLGLGMKRVTMFGGIVGFAFGRSASARAGSFANVIATYIADSVGQYFGEKFIETQFGKQWMGKLYLEVGKLPSYLEITNKVVLEKAAGITEVGEKLYKAGTSLEHTVLTEFEFNAIKSAKEIAGKVGMEVGGIILEGSLLIPFRKILRGIGHRIDQHTVLQSARQIGKTLDKKDQEKKKERSRNDNDLRRFLSTYAMPAYSQLDLLTNTDYTYGQRGLLLALRHNDYGQSTLDSVSPYVTMSRRIRAGVASFFTTRNSGKGKTEDWRIRLTRSYNAPAYSQVDIASNPQYSVTQRLSLMALSHTEKGEEALEYVSPTVTNVRRIQAWMEGLSHPHQVGEHAATHLIKHGHHAVRHALKDADDKAQENGLSAAAADVLHAFSGAVNDTGRTIKEAQKAHQKRANKVKIRTKSCTQDHALDENMLHNAYSRYINYGHEGDALSYSDREQGTY